MSAPDTGRAVVDLTVGEIVRDIERREWMLHEGQVNFNWPDIYLAAIYSRRDHMADGYALRVHSDLQETPDRALKQVYALALRSVVT